MDLSRSLKDSSWDAFSILCSCMWGHIYSMFKTAMSGTRRGPSSPSSTCAFKTLSSAVRLWGTIIVLQRAVILDGLLRVTAINVILHIEDFPASSERFIQSIMYVPYIQNRGDCCSWCFRFVLSKWTWSSCLSYLCCVQVHGTFYHCCWCLRRGLFEPLHIMLLISFCSNPSCPIRLNVRSISEKEMSTFHQLRETALFSALRPRVYQEIYGTGRTYFTYKGICFILQYGRNLAWHWVISGFLLKERERIKVTALR